MPLFGTDGVRGTPGVAPLDETTIARLGAALVKALDRPAPRVLAGRDTRDSGDWIVDEFARGVAAAGGTLAMSGVLPTPAVAYLAASCGYDAGISVSASHNPYPDNGIKVLTARGEKASEELEARIEALAADPSWNVSPTVAPRVERVDLVEPYMRHARSVLTAAGALRAARVAIDCANGATSDVAPRIFRELGLDVTAVSASPDGRNINAACGSTHPEALSRLVASDGYRLGVAFDGDGDRAIFVDRCGRVVDGDAILFMCARHLKAAGRLTGNAIVATVMSNVGLELALRAAGIALYRCSVGDRYVMVELARRGLALGGEQSGHVIFRDRLPTGDGIVTALSVLQVMAETGRELDELAGDLKTYPQVLVNVRVREKADYAAIPEVVHAIDRVQAKLAGEGRLLVRYSGTEPLLRIMIEGRDQQEIRRWADQIADAVRTHLG